jgi:small subunit ribosomal protein S14
MANKAMIQREIKRQRLVMKYAKKRASLKEQIKQTSSLKEKLTLHRKLQQLPRNSSAVRLHNRCTVTGRPKGYYRDFGLSRHVLREMAHEGLLPGVQKSSW